MVRRLSVVVRILVGHVLPASGRGEATPLVRMHRDGKSSRERGRGYMRGASKRVQQHEYRIEVVQLRSAALRLQDSAAEKSDAKFSRSRG